jgi:hypothetical protein
MKCLKRMEGEGAQKARAMKTRSMKDPMREQKMPE